MKDGDRTVKYKTVTIPERIMYYGRKIYKIDGERMKLVSGNEQEYKRTGLLRLNRNGRNFVGNT